MEEKKQAGCAEAAEGLRRLLLLNSFPVAVSFSAEEELPEKARRPSSSLGHPVAICQGTAMVRSMGWTLGFLKEDHACPPSFLIFGLDEKAKEAGANLGETLSPLFGASRELCESTNEHMIMLPVGKYKSITLAPLEKAPFDPDVVLVYGNPAQVSRLVQGAVYHRGGAVTSSFTGRNSCVSEMVAPLVKGECQVIVPGSGERVFAHVQDTEMCFSFPGSWLEDIVSGLETTHRLGAMRYPTPFQGMRGVPQFPKTYHSMMKELGLLE